MPARAMRTPPRQSQMAERPTRHTRRPLPSAADRLRRLPTDGYSAARRDRLPVPLRYKGLPDFNRPATFRQNLVHAREGRGGSAAKRAARPPQASRPHPRRTILRFENESPTIEAISYDKGRSSSQLPGYEQDTTTYLRYRVYPRTRREREAGSKARHQKIPKRQGQLAFQRPARLSGRLDFLGASPQLQTR